MSIKAVSWAFDQKLSDPLAKLVLLAVADHYNESSGDAWPSIERLMEYTEASRSTVIRKLKILETTGRISRTKRYNNTDIYRLNFGGCHSETCHTDIFEVSHRHTNRKEPLTYKDKAKSKKQKVVDWKPDEADRAYAAELGLNADDVLESIRLWDEQNGHKAAYASCSAFWKNWCRKDAKRLTGASKRDTGGNSAKGKPKGLTERQKSFIDNLIPKYRSAYPHDDMGLVRDALTEMMSNGLDIEGWYKLGYGYKHYTEF